MTYLRTILLAALLACLAACSSVQTQAILADQLAGATNVAVAELGDRYQGEGEALIASAGSQAEAEALLHGLRERWAPVWATLRAFAAAHDLWASYLERGELAPADVYAAVVEAWCGFGDLARARGAPLPEVVPCGGQP